MLTVWDDGRGLNRRKIIEKAVKLELIESADNMTEPEIWQLIFQPGFSTTDNVTDVSGRGVGLDVVRQAVELGRPHVHDGEDSR